MPEKTKRKMSRSERKSAPRKSRAASSAKKLSNKNTIIRAAISIIACFVIVGLLVTLINKDANEVKSQILKHLRDTYGTEQFVVKDIKLNGSGFGVNGIWQGTAYSKDSGLEFYVSKGEKSEVVADSYTNVTWAKEETDRSAPEIRKIIPTAETVSISMGVDKDFLKTLENPLGSYAKARRDSQEYLSYTLTIVNRGELPNAATALFKSVEQLRGSGLKNVDIQYAEKYPGEKDMNGKVCEGEKALSVEAIDKCISEKVTIKEGEL